MRRIREQSCIGPGSIRMKWCERQKLLHRHTPFRHQNRVQANNDLLDCLHAGRDVICHPLALSLVHRHLFSPATHAHQTSQSVPQRPAEATTRWEARNRLHCTRHCTRSCTRAASARRRRSRAGSSVGAISRARSSKSHNATNRSVDVRAWFIAIWRWIHLRNRRP